MKVILMPLYSVHYDAHCDTLILFLIFVLGRFVTLFICIAK